MSEYQYYEFQAVDRPLTKDEMTALRLLSTRATITSTRFVNVYNWGDLRGDPLKMMKDYFDAHVYVANWGTSRLMLRLPLSVVDSNEVQRYCVADGAAMHVTSTHVILDLSSEEEGGSGWIEDEDAEGWMPALLPLRGDLASGDLRALYLAWLATLQADMVDEEALEPPVPPGLGKLSAPLTALVEFLRIDEDLIAVAATQSGETELPALAARDLEQWVRALPAAEKDGLLLRLLQGDAPHLSAELLTRFRRERAPSTRAPSAADRGRTAADLLAAAEHRAETRRRREAAREAQARARREREEAAARAAYLEGLAGSEEAMWRQVEMLIETKRPADYDQSVRLLVDLRDLSVRQQTSAEFASRLQQVRVRHARKPSFLSRLDRAALPHG